jgi:hypothetical protein
MDAVFGEGDQFITGLNFLLTPSADERQDRMDNESLASERRSLVPHTNRGWFGRLFKRESSGPAYQPVADNDE